MKIKIESIRIEYEVDECADTYFIGEYTDTYHEWAICRHCGRYLVDANKPETAIELIKDKIWRMDETIDKKKIDCLVNALDRMESRQHDCHKSHREYNYFLPYASGEKQGTKEYRKYGMQDFNRMESLNRGDWCFIGIIAKAEIAVNGTIQTIRSGGLWGIESDSGEYLEEVKNDELSALSDILLEMGIGKRAISYAMRNVEDNNEF